QWTNCFVVAWPTKPLHKIATAIRDAGWRALRAHTGHWAAPFNSARNPRAAYLTYRCTALVTRCPLQFQLQSKRSNVLLLARSPASQSAGLIKALFPNLSH